MSGKQVSDTWEHGNPYEQYMGRWSRQVARRFLAWLNVPVGRIWVDVGCGTGALCAEILEHCAPAAVIGIEPSEGFIKTATRNLAGRAAIKAGSAASIPLPHESADVVVSGLVLNFVPDPRAALADMKRVAASGGTVAAYVWDYADKMELTRFFWDAAVALDAGAAPLHEGNRFPLCSPQALEKLFAEAALENIQVSPIDVATPFENFEDYWQPFLGGQGPAPAYAMSLEEPARARLREHIRAHVPTLANGSLSLTARAWAVRATVRK